MNVTFQAGAFVGFKGFAGDVIHQLTVLHRLPSVRARQVTNTATAGVRAKEVTNTATAGVRAKEVTNTATAGVRAKEVTNTATAGVRAKEVTNTATAAPPPPIARRQVGGTMPVQSPTRGTAQTGAGRGVVPEPGPVDVDPSQAMFYKLNDKTTWTKQGALIYVKENSQAKERMSDGKGAAATFTVNIPAPGRYWVWLKPMPKTETATRLMSIWQVRRLALSIPRTSARGNGGVPEKCRDQAGITSLILHRREFNFWVRNIRVSPDSKM